MKSKMLYSALALCVSGWAGVAAAAEARGPIWDDVSATVGHTTYYYCNGVDWHGALDIGNGTCSVWNMRGMLVGSYYWNVSAGCGSNCQSTPQTCANYAWVNGANGYRFYQYHMNANVSSYSQTCDRCALGLVGATGQAYGAHVHGQHNQNGTQLTAWYSGYVSCGSKSSGNHVMGRPAM